MKHLNFKKALIPILIFTLSANHLCAQNSLSWGKQFGSDKEEYSMNQIVDSEGNILVAGWTTGIMDGVGYGKKDGFLTKMDSLGNILWSRQFGTAGDEDIQWSAVDNLGSVYITGSTTGEMNEKSFGKEDIFVIKYNQKGEKVWVRQFGTDSTDIAKGIYADNKEQIFITGLTGGKLGQTSFGKTDFFIMKLDNKGNLLQTIQSGTPVDDNGYSITGGFNSDIYISGTTWGDIASKNKGFIDGFAAHFSDKLELIKNYQFGSEGFDIAMIINVDNENNVYVGGSTSGNFGGKQIGEGDAYLLKLNEKGEILWNTQFGTQNNDGVRGIDLNSTLKQQILISGVMNLPPAQGFIRSYKKDGSLLWERNFITVGKSGGTSGKTVTSDKKGNLYHIGLTGGNLFGNSSGAQDIYVVKIR